MRRRLFSRARIGALAIACLATIAATGAAPVTAKYRVYMRGVGKNGYPGDSGGQYAQFSALLNTSTGYFTGSARRQVVNLSGKQQSYYNVDYFVDRDDFKLSFSLYAVSIKGVASYTASGYVD